LSERSDCTDPVSAKSEIVQERQKTIYLFLVSHKKSK